MLCSAFLVISRTFYDYLECIVAVKYSLVLKVDLSKFELFTPAVATILLVQHEWSFWYDSFED